MSTEFFIICNIVVWASVLGYLCYYIFDKFNMDRITDGRETYPWKMLGLGMSDKMITEVRTVSAFNAGKRAAQHEASIAECPDFFMPCYHHWLDGYRTVNPLPSINIVGDLVHQLSCYDAATLLDRSYTIKVNDNGELQLEVIE